jgi:hypothetical protein
MPGPPQFGRASITNVRNVRSPHWRGCWASLIAALCHQLRFASTPTHSPQRQRARAESTNSPSNHHDTSHIVPTVPRRRRREAPRPGARRGAYNALGVGLRSAPRRQQRPRDDVPFGPASGPGYAAFLALAVTSRQSSCICASGRRTEAQRRPRRAQAASSGEHRSVGR